MASIIGVCGLDCAECLAYKATQADDNAARERVAEQWRKEYNVPGITAAGINCDGCMAGGRLIGHCQECEPRLCAVGRGVANCGACPDYACEKIGKMQAFMPPDAKARLDGIHSAL
jgi:predicted nucleic acid binding AN1-type Zn finger protein